MSERYLEDNPAFLQHLTRDTQFPTAINVELTTKCNLRCIMCPKTAGLPRTTPNRTMDKNLFNRLLVDIIPRVYRVDVVGDGEVLLAIDLLEQLLIRCRELGVLVNICTNGILLTESVSRMLVQNKLTDMNISIDAVRPETFEYIRGASLEKLIQNIRTLNSIKQEMQSKLPSLHFTMVGMTENIREFPDLVKLAAELGGSSVTLQAMGEFEAVQNKSVYLRNPELGKESYEAGKRIGAELGIRVGLWPETQFESASGDKSNAAQPIKNGVTLRKDCYFPWDVPYFTTTGEVLPCCAMTSMGSLQKQSFEEIWSGKEYTRLRATIKGLSPNHRCVICDGRGWKPPTIADSLVTLGSDDPQLGLGWFQPELDQNGIGYRWTRDRATLFLANNSGNLLLLELARDIHEQATAHGQVLVQGKSIGRFDLTGASWQLFSGSFSEDQTDLIKVDIIPDTVWRPSDLFPLNPDRRLLGIKVHAAEVRSDQPECTFDDTIQFFGLILRKTNRTSLSLSYLWKSVKPISANLSIFVHFVHESHITNYESVLERLKRKYIAAETYFFQHDHEPVNGLKPTSQWNTGEFIREAYTITVPTGIISGRYFVKLGIWNPIKDRRRLPVTQTVRESNRDSVIVASVDL